MPTLHWLTREADVGAAGRAPYRLLEEEPGLSAGEAEAANMLIQGDNLEALKALLPFYAGRVKCVYIDPPYNTRSAFAHYDDNLEHATWLSLMWPRLELLRDLLAEDGSIWVSIDDHEAHYLKVVMDEVFGRGNFIATCIWHKKHTRANDARWLSDNHDFIVSFAKDKNLWKRNLLPRSQDTKGYTNPDNDPRGVWASGPCHAKTPNEKDIYEIITPSGRKVMPPSGTSWRFSKEKFQELVGDNRIDFGKIGDNIPRYKRFLSEVRNGLVPTTLWLRDEVGDNQEAKSEVKIFNVRDVFTTPKPERLIMRILEIATAPGDLVLDSFLGSGTTAAVAHKMNRQWIGVEMGQHAVTHCAPRLTKVIEGEQGGISKAVGWQGGGGFRFYRLGPPAFDENGRICPDVRFPLLAAHVWFAETGRPWQAPAEPSPFLGAHEGRGYALLYNGILGDRSAGGGNVLTKKTLGQVRAAAGGFGGPLTIYAARSMLGSAALKAEGLSFRQTPYDVAARA